MVSFEMNLLHINMHIRIFTYIANTDATTIKKMNMDYYMNAFKSFISQTLREWL